MLLKSTDEKSHFVSQLQDILAHPSLPRERKPFVEREIRALQSQIETQGQSSKAIDEFLETSEQVVVLHDLRLQHNGRTVTVDHVLINLGLEIVVLSTQLYTSGLKVSSRGDFEKVVAGRSSPTSNPLEDAVRALDAVKEACRGISWPTRLGVQLIPEFRHAALFHANVSIERDSPTIYPNIQGVDEFLLEYVKVNASLVKGLVSLARGVSLKTLEQLAGRLVSLHKPLNDDFATRFGLKSSATRSAGPIKPTRSTPVGAISMNSRPASVRTGSASRPASGRITSTFPVANSGAHSAANPAVTSPVKPASASVSIPARTPEVARSEQPRNESRLPSLKKPVQSARPHAAPRVAPQGVPQEAQTAKALSRAVAAGALTPRRASDRHDKRPLAPQTGASAESRPTTGPLRVPDQPESFRKDVSLHAELLRPRTEDSPPRPVVPRQFQTTSRRPAPVPVKPAPVRVEPEPVAVVAPEPVTDEDSFSAVTPGAAPVEPVLEGEVPAPAVVAPAPAVTSAATPAGKGQPQGYYCKDCSVPVTTQMAKFCWQNKHRFAGRVYCTSCQEKHPIPSFPRKEARPGRTGQW